MAPVINNYIPYTALIDGSIDICDIYEMIEALSVKQENEARVRAALNPKG
jgi:hypothetical protein